MNGSLLAGWPASWLAIFLAGCAAGCSGSPLATQLDGVDAAARWVDAGSVTDVEVVPQECGPTSGACALATIIATTDVPTLVAMTSTHLYFTLAGNTLRPRLSRIPIAGGDVEVLVDGPEGQVIGTIAVDPVGMLVYFVLEDVAAKAGSLMRLPLDVAGAAAAPERVDSTAPPVPITQIGDIAVDGANVYYSGSYLLNGKLPPAAGGLYQILGSGGAPVRLLMATSGKGLRLHRGYLYFAGDGVEGTNVPSALVRLAVGGGDPQLLMADSSVPFTFEVSDGGILWTSGGLMNLPLVGGTPRVLFASPASQDSVVVFNPAFGGDLDSVYLGLNFWALTSPVPAMATQLVRVPLDGGASRIIFQVEEYLNVGRIIVSGPSVYFSFPSAPGLAKIDRCGCRAH